MGTPDWPRFLKYVAKQDDGCWIWIGAVRGNGRNEYGAFWAGSTQRAHIVSYVWMNGEPNADLHHTCHRSMCVNPEHLRPVTVNEPHPHHRGPLPNVCAHGHEFTPENTYFDPQTGWRQCRTCKRETAARRHERDRDRINARRREIRPHITYEPRPCENCGMTYQPIRSTSQFCQQRVCINDRQRKNRERRLA